MRLLVVPLLLSFLAVSAFGQQRVSAEQANHHVFAVVPLIGTGKPGDPKRPMFVPSDAERAALPKGTRPAILSYHMQVSDDGKSALVEFVGASPLDLKPISASQAPGVIAFERGKTTKAQIEAEFKKHKANFDADQFIGRGR
jgi:hypothetical protein